jgi:DNA-directed RNA polymerase subunit RPC12/RpoP
MFIRFNYRCPTCGHEEERFIKKEQMDEQMCPACTVPLTRLPAAPRTTFRFADRRLKQ